MEFLPLTHYANWHSTATSWCGGFACLNNPATLICPNLLPAIVQLLFLCCANSCPAGLSECRRSLTKSEHCPARSEVWLYHNGLSIASPQSDTSLRPTFLITSLNAHVSITVPGILNRFAPWLLTTQIRYLVLVVVCIW